MTNTMESRMGASRTAVRARRAARLTGVIAAVVAAFAGWAVAELGLGIDLRQPGGDIGAAAVGLASASASLAGWALLAVLERFTARPSRWWVAIAVGFAVVSLIAPLTTPGIDAAGRVVLALLHLVVAAVLIPLLYRTAVDRTGPRR